MKTTDRKYIDVREYNDIYLFSSKISQFAQTFPRKIIWFRIYNMFE